MILYIYIYILSVINYFVKLSPKRMKNVKI